jgi:hypothetical protein
MRTTVDEEYRLENVFFALSGMITGFKTYGQFFEVDATCKTNLFGMPLLVFVGVDNCGITTVFGFCLIRVESESSVTWAFECLKDAVGEESWIKCTSVMTDGAACYPLVIARTISHAKHVRCIWHIQEDLKSNLLNKIMTWQEFMLDWQKAVHAVNESDFNNGWSYLLSKYPTAADYLSKLYEIRHKFVTVYVRKICTINCFATQRCEIINRVKSY